ncbi:ABC transporter substrate-binding protein [Mesorhizobium sp. BR1-1-16]|uniref:ABC transporter substrate-binding protein n=1 Tax=Mesorhizobium sp. BR1-1-16 TaxID=2876653 RepID=UPI001CC9F68D|nr:ABC transporter substrate-binding protein [Mesorhizobium sp. BR1-1-16]MBZ9936997.1 ABC transporter substrate-binding protein [Mesorhizobium sp. BR1-1-16]
MSLRLLVTVWALSMWLAMPASAAQPAAIVVGYLGESDDPLLPVGPLDEVPAREGLEGVRLGIADDATTGRFTNQRFELVERLVPKDGDVVAAAQGLAGRGIGLVIANLDAGPLLAAADALSATGTLLINSRAPDDALRGGECRPDLLHTIASRAMLADGLAQYLVWKKWTRWLLVVGRSPGDRLYADAVRRAASRFGAEIVDEKTWAFQPGNARTDTGHVALQTEIPTFTRAADYDVLVVADERDEFGAYLEGRTDRPRPVAGTHGLIATAWSPVAEQWGATQLQNRFHRQAGRWMTSRDYAGWVAARAIGEAAVRTESADAAKISGYLRGPDFLLAAFKGQGLSFRLWDGQLREPILIVGSRLLVSISPQAAFLHRVSELDSLGVDEEETTCKR